MVFKSLETFFNRFNFLTLMRCKVKLLEILVRRRRRRRRENNKLAEEGIITLRGEIIKLRENIKIVEEGIKKIKKEDNLLSLTILIDFFQIAVYLTRFVLKQYLVSDFIASNY